MPEAKTTEDQTSEDQADEQTDSVSADTAVQDETEAQIVNDSEAQTGDAAETAEDVSLDNGEAVQADSDVPSGADTATVEEDFFTAQDGLLKIKTNGHTGYYLFNEDGYLVTGRMTREPGTAGYTGTTSVEWYFLESGKATLYSDSQGKAVTPWTSNMGQQQKKYWLWTGSTFRYYNASGNFTSVTDLKISGKLQKIGSDYYTLKTNGAPYTGIKKLAAGSSRQKIQTEFPENFSTADGCIM